MNGTFNILDYGAAGDGITDDAGAIQRAVDSCFANYIYISPVDSCGAQTSYICPINTCIA